MKEKEQVFWMNQIQHQALSVRQLEQALTPTEKRKQKIEDLFLKEEEDKLEKLLGSKVKIKLQTKTSGNIQIYFSNQEEYQRIINSLK